MRILAVETSTLAGSAAVLDGDRVVGAVLVDVALTHSERLMAMVDRLLADCGLELEGLDGLAVSVGPGSFTGLRIGIAAVKGLALATGLPVAAVPTLDALAAALPFSAAAICPLLDARKGEVYLSLYRWRSGRIERMWDYLALAPAEAAARIEPPAVLLGDAAEACLALVPPGADVWLAPPAQRAPSAALVAQLGHSALVEKGGVDVDDLVPIYLRPSEAQLGARSGPRGS
jgi:tRNA threonylcarbamoyladenosine biosynthesis protein TsaB